MNTKNETLYWTIGGVALALLALYAMSRSSSSSTSSGGGISPNNLVSEVNAVNTNAAAVEQTRITTLGSYATHASDDSVHVFDTLAHTAEDELSIVQTAHTTRLANEEQFQLGEYVAHENAITAQGAIAGAVRQSADANATDLAKAKLAADTAHIFSDNAVTAARINKGSSFGNFMQGLLGSVTQIFSGGLNLGSKSSGTVATAPPAASMGGMNMSG